MRAQGRGSSSVPSCSSVAPFLGHLYEADFYPSRRLISRILTSLECSSTRSSPTVSISSLSSELRESRAHLPPSFLPSLSFPSLLRPRLFFTSYATLSSSFNCPLSLGIICDAPIPLACGSLAILNAVLNFPPSPDSEEDKLVLGDELQNLKSFTEGMDSMVSLPPDPFL